MKLLSYDGYTFATNGYFAAFEAGTARGMWSVLPQIRPRHNGAGVLTGVQVTERAIPVVFGYSGVDTYETAFLRLLGRLDPLDAEPRKLVAQLNDGTQVECWAIVTMPGGATVDDDVNLLAVTFVTTSPVWQASTENSKTTSFTTSSTTALLPSGGQTTAPVRIEITFSASTADRHWVYPVVITNTTELNWYREVIVVDIGDTTSGITTNSNQVTVFYQGVEQACTPLNWGTLRTYVAFPVTLAAGDQAVYEVVAPKTSGESDAITRTRSLTSASRFDGNYCAFDLGADTGTATSGASTTLTRSTSSWTVDRWAGGFVEILSGTGAGQCRRIASNTATALTVTRAWTTNPDATSVFAVHTSGWFVDGGIASAATSTTLTDSSQAWDTNTLAGGTVTILSGTGSGQTRSIDSNTATQVTVGTAWTTTPNTTSVYVIRRRGYHSYYVDPVSHSEAQRGGWQINKRYAKPSRVLFGGDICNGWRRTTYLDNRDDYSQLRVTVDTGLGAAGHWFPILNAVRRKGDDRRLQEEGTGDGVTITSALGYVGMRFDYRQRNVNGVGKFVVAVREAGGEDWQDVLTDGTTRASLTTVAAQYADFTGLGTVNHIYMGVLPADDVEIPNTAAVTDQVEARWHKTLRLWQTPGAATIAVNAREDKVRLSGRISTDPATLGELRFGRSAGVDRELFLPDDGTTRLVVDSGIGQVYTQSGPYSYSPKTYVPWAMLAIQLKQPQDASDTGERIASRWLETYPGVANVTITDMPGDGSAVLYATAAYFG